MRLHKMAPPPERCRTAVPDLGKSEFCMLLQKPQQRSHYSGPDWGQRLCCQTSGTSGGHWSAAVPRWTQGGSLLQILIKPEKGTKNLVGACSMQVPTRKKDRVVLVPKCAKLLQRALRTDRVALCQAAVLLAHSRIPHCHFCEHFPHITHSSTWKTDILLLETWMAGKKKIH